MSCSKPTMPKSRSPCAPPSKSPSKSFWHSEPSPLLTGHRTTRELPKTADVVIIGSGMTGASVAYHLLNNDSTTETGKDRKEDYSVVMLEAREACWGATGRNGGHCQPALFAHPHDPSIGHFELQNFQTIHSLIEAKKIDCEFVVQPAVRSFYSRRLVNEVELALLTIQETAPKQAELMRLVTDKAELAKLRVPAATGAIVTKVAARMWPYKFVSRILEDLLLATELKGSFNLQTFTTVESLTEHDSDSWTVKTSRGDIKASKVVLATNAYASQLLPNFSDLIVPVRGQMSSLIPLPSASGHSRLRTSFGFDGEAIDEYLIQRPNEKGSHLMYGGGRQVGSQTVGVADDSVVDDEIAKYLRKSLIERLALPEGDVKETLPLDGKCQSCVGQRVRCFRSSPNRPCINCIRFERTCTNPPSPNESSASTKPTELDATYEWTGIMGYSRDEHPWVGPVPGKSNLFMSAGYTGHGMPNTWLCGRAVVKMVQADFDRQRAPTYGVSSHRINEYRGFCTQEAGLKSGLPKSYLVTEERLKKAMQLEDVETVDRAEMERGRRKQKADRMPSGYA